jgi:hypothetical protein
MPTVLIDGPYSFVFFSSDREEPLHIHVKRDDKLAKFWLSPIRMAKNRGFDGFESHELRRIERLVKRHQDELEEAWHEYFDG